MGGSPTTTMGLKLLWLRLLVAVLLPTEDKLSTILFRENDCEEEEEEEEAEEEEDDC